MRFIYLSQFNILKHVLVSSQQVGIKPSLDGHLIEESIGFLLLI